jgi:argonaute-like protein/RNase H domain-containing protein/MID domain-containing protein
MAPRYDDISRAAYQLATHAAPLTVRYRALPFPEAWNPTILNLCNLGRPDAELYRTVPTYRMDGVLQSLAPDLVVRSRLPDPAQRAGDAWLYVPADVPDPLPAGVFDKLLGVWLRDLRPEREHLRDVQGALAELLANPPQWFGTTVDILGCPTTAGGTAAPYPRQYQLASDAVARAILNLGPYDTGAGALQFRAVPRGPRQQGAELISQPLQHDVKGRTWWYSIVIAVTLHTVPFDPRPRLHLHTGVRRWATHPDPRTGRVRLPFGVATSVYLKPSLPWLQETPLSERYAVARLAYDRTTRSHGWGGNGPASILRRIHLTQPFPDPVELLTDPTKWIGDGVGVRAAIVHSNRMGSHAIGAGLMSHQRSRITEWAEQALPEGLRRVPKLSRSRAGSSAPDNARPAPSGDVAKKAEQTRAANARRIALAVAVQVNEGLDPVAHAHREAKADPPLNPPKVTLRLLWQTPALRDASIEALAEILGLEGDGRFPDLALTTTDFDEAGPGRPARLVWRTPQLTIELRCLRLTEGIADTLGIDSNARPRGQALAAAIKARRDRTRDFLVADGADPREPALALVEIDRRQDFDHSTDDPKFAVRLGCADAGVLTQFAVVPRRSKGYNSEKSLGHRVRSGWQDGLRQLGVRVLPEHAMKDGLPKMMRYVATWMVKRRKDGPTRLPRHTPVAVMVSPLSKGSGLAKVTGWDPKALQWIPYPKLLLRLVKIAEIPDIEFDGPPEADTDQAGRQLLPTLPHQRSGATTGTTPQRKGATYQVWRQDREEQRKETARYLQKMIRSLRGEPTMLLTHSQNSRMHWPWLQDGQTEMDLIRTGHAPPAGLDPDLRMIRIRDADGRETPQWWGNAGPSGINGLPPGLWVDRDDAGRTVGRSFYSTTAKASTFRDSAVEADKLAPRPLRQGINKGKPTVDTHIPAWNPALIEVTVLACHPDQGDVPEALALAVHQLRQAPDYLDALSMPLPMHLASLAQQYVLPTVADSQPDSETDDNLEPTAAQASTLGLIVNSPVQGEIDPDTDPSDAPGLAQEPDDLDEMEVPSPEMVPMSGS